MTLHRTTLVALSLLAFATTASAAGKSYVELHYESATNFLSAESEEQEADALFAKGDKAGGCAVMMGVMRHRQKSASILATVKKSFDEGKGTKESRALFGEITMNASITAEKVKSTALKTAEKGC